MNAEERYQTWLATLKSPLERAVAETAKCYGESIAYEWGEERARERLAQACADLAAAGETPAILRKGGAGA